MKKQRKIVFWAASLLLTGALAAGGTLAYLTDKDSVTNQFVVGKVDIEGNEPSYAPDPDGKTNHIVPTQVIPKDPRIKNKGKNDSYVYMDVSIPIAKVIVADTSGNRLNGGAAVDTELFSMNQLSKKWVLMYKKKQNNSMVYTYLYNEVLAAGKTTDPLFTSVTAANIVEGQLDEKEVDIPINYYAIQALNTGEGSTAAERAAKAWEKYVNQNKGLSSGVTKCFSLRVRPGVRWRQPFGCCRELRRILQITRVSGIVWCSDIIQVLSMKNFRHRRPYRQGKVW